MTYETIYQITKTWECYDCCDCRGHSRPEGFVTSYELAEHYRAKYGYIVTEIENIDSDTIQEMESEARSERLQQERRDELEANRKAQSEAMMALARPHLRMGEEVLQFDRGFGIEGVIITIRTLDGRTRTVTVDDQ